ncbi:MAG: hypothetical protein CTY39_10755 [Hyphomicrobium sp.]|nr:MAG: hypothetical protein CTY39_10755 [Hyphomicrobium sp.]
MSKTFKINGTTAVPVSAIRKIKPLTDADRERIAGRYEKLDADAAAKFQIQIEFADKSTKLATESLDDIKGQGVALVNLGSDRFVPAANIRSAEPFTKEDAERVTDKDYKLNSTFRSRVETSAGAMLSSATPAQVIERREKALEAVPAKAEKKTAAPKVPSAE